MFMSLDFLYVPTRNPARDVEYYSKTLGGTLLFHVKAMGTEVAGLRLSEQGPIVLLAEHLEGQIPIFVYRVHNLQQTMKQLEREGWTRGNMLEIPQGPCCSFIAEGGQRLAIYELARPEANEHFFGRFD